MTRRAPTGIARESTARSARPRSIETSGPPRRVEVEGGARSLALWIEPAGAGGSRPGLLFLYVGITAAGPGIPASVRDHLFEPFVPTKPPGHGTGLGLAVCHTIIERLGGAIEVEPPPEGGARFTVRLPIAREAQRPE